MKKQYFTLLEMLIVMTLILVIAGSLTFNVLKAVKEERFHAGVALIQDRLQLAEDLMLLMNADVIVTLEKPKESTNGVLCTIEIGQSTSHTIARLINSASLVEGVSSVTFQDPSNRMFKDQIKLKFMSGGSVMSQGVLTFTAENKNLTEKIPLLGYPRPIVRDSSSLITALALEYGNEYYQEYYPRDIQEEREKK